MTDPTGAAGPHHRPPYPARDPSSAATTAFTDPRSGRRYAWDPVTGTSYWLPTASAPTPVRRRRWPWVVLGSLGVLFALAMVASILSGPSASTSSGTTAGTGQAAASSAVARIGGHRLGRYIVRVLLNSAGRL